MEENQDLGQLLANKDDSEGRMIYPITQIPVIEEVLNIDKKTIETGKVQFIKNVHEELVTINEPIVQEEVEVERISKNQDVTSAPPSVRHEGNTMIIPVVKEVLIVEKRLMLVEELHVTKRKIETPYSQQFSIRKEEVVVERLSNDELLSNS